MGAARTRVTAHFEVHKVLRAAGLSVDLLPWVTPSASNERRRAGDGVPTLTLAASALARKGAHEVAWVARRLGARVIILGSAPSELEVWAGINWTAVGYAGPWLEQSDVVLLPAYVEHQPRAILRALAEGVPVIASPACGLGSRVGLVEVAAGSAESLELAVRKIMKAGGAGAEASQ
jgi:glycosyltransferase involved in cell wall biosynthesis